ncbi:hypothetical protein [Photobacterium satsumensis]|uniref:hypothetical protein n=1 Tax=Photobacterium satsumensis TaxID=2910239 RepID=UPI003D0F5444
MNDHQYIPKLFQDAGFRGLSALLMQGEALQECRSLLKTFNDGVDGLTHSKWRDL